MSSSLKRSSLRRFVGAQPAAPTVERCEMCREVIDERHGHVVEIEHRSLMCACRPCYLLFTQADAGKFRAVPERYRHDPTLTQAEWQSLGIPVNTVFFLRSDSGLAAFYPSPAGATECLLDLDAWVELALSHPMLAEARPEVEAILVRDTECYLVPIDVCYRLVGVVRVYWKGFDGGQEAQEQIDGIFAGIRARAVAAGSGA
ncbi:MAG: DUF5947 family protein [Kibdelosporangium sp.]